MRITQTNRHARAAYSMIEVLVAMGVFVIGFAAVASIFPVAAMLQKQTVSDLYAQQGARSAEAALKARGLLQADLVANMVGAPWTGFDTDQRVRSVPPSLLSGAVTAGTRQWFVGDRSTPLVIPNAYSRDIYWVPLVRDSNAAAGSALADWQVYLFVMQKEQNATYAHGVNSYDDDDGSTPSPIPQVVNLTGVSIPGSDPTRFEFDNDDDNDGEADRIRVGDPFLDEFGVVYTAASADADGVGINGVILPNGADYPDEIWYAAPPIGDDKPSPIRKIVGPITGVVK